jgi:hypothetical protein
MNRFQSGFVRRKAAWRAVSATVGWLFTGILAACAAPAPQPDYARLVNEQLQTADVAGVRADWRAPEPVMLLTGYVATAAKRAQAEDIATRLAGTRLRIFNDIAIVPQAEIDALLRKDCELIATNPRWRGHVGNLTFGVREGTVRMGGSVANDAVRDELVRAVRELNGVVDVIDGLQSGPPTAPTFP